MKPREGEYLIRTEDILAAIEENRDSLALVLFSGVQYYTGQLFDLKTITKAGHAVGANVGFDLAHAVGNVQLLLNEWQVDFACWCSYKYLNAGPGSIGGLFIHEKHHSRADLKRFLGWWGNDGKSRFQMNNDKFDGICGAQVYRMSNPCVLAVVSLLGSLQVFEKTSMEQLSRKSRQLTGYLEALLKQEISSDAVKIITPADPEQRGCQLSLLFQGNVKAIFERLSTAGVVCDKREPDCLRIAPVPLYNTFEDIWKFVQILKQALEK